jgi:hypothetical protein
MSYNPCEPGETMLKFMFISAFIIVLPTLAIIGLIFFVTRDGILVSMLALPTALVVVIIYVVYLVRRWVSRIDSSRGL